MDEFLVNAKANFSMSSGKFFLRKCFIMQILESKTISTEHLAYYHSNRINTVVIRAEFHHVETGLQIWR